MVRAGLCGFGRLGHVHANSLWALEGVELKAVCDIFPDKLKLKELGFNIPQESGSFDITKCPTYTDFDEMLDKEDLDVVVIALPTDIHSQYSIKAMQKGLHVFCEKPMSLTLADCDEMIAASKKYGVKLQIGQCLRFWPEYEYLLKSIKDNRYGKLRSLFMERLGGYSVVEPVNWYGDHKRSGGSVMDLHVHDVDWVQMAFGDPSRIQAAGVIGNTGGVDDVTSLWNYPDGLVVTIRGSWMRKENFFMGYKAFFENAELNYGLTTGAILSESPDKDPIKIETSNESAYLRELRYFLECVRGEHENTICPSESCRNSIALALKERDMILESMSL